MADTILGAAVDFLESFGFFDVILPFLLVFTIVFGILVKTKIFGTYDGKPKKNINSMIAFVIAFFVVAAKQIVNSLQEALPIVALILIAIVSFLMLIGSFASSDKEFNFMDMFEGWKLPLAVLFFGAVFLVFIHSFGWLMPIIEYITGAGAAIFLMIAFVLIMGGIVAFVMGGKVGKPEE